MVELSLNLRETKDDLMNLNVTKLDDSDGRERDRAANLLCPPKSATSVKFVQFSDEFSGHQSRHLLHHTAANHRPQSEERMEFILDCLLVSSIFLLTNKSTQTCFCRKWWRCSIWKDIFEGDSY